MHKLLVIGAGIGQVPIVKLAKSRGIYTIVATSPGNWPAVSIADEEWQIDVYEKNRIAERARRERVTAVISDQNDLMMPTVAYIAAELGLPGNTPECVNSYCNKNAFRSICNKNNIPCPRHVAIHEEMDLREAVPFPLPWVIKPADSQSSIGVKRVDRFEECSTALHNALLASRTGAAIVEEFFAGHELVCEGFIEKGLYYHLATGDRKYFDLPNTMIPSQTLFPSVAPIGVQKQIVEFERVIASCIRPNFGIVHSEYLYNENGDIRIVESAIRGGGVYISSHLIPLATGIDINSLLLDHALGISVDINTSLSSRINSAAGYVCFYLPEGTVIETPSTAVIDSLPFVAKICLENISEGSKTKPMAHKGQRYGPILVTGSNRQDLDSNIEMVKEVCAITVEDDSRCRNGAIWS